MEFAHLPHLGVGIGFREELKSDIFLNRDEIDFVEITSDHFLNPSSRKRDELLTLRDHFTLIPHSLDLSLGSAEGIDTSYLDQLAELVELIDPPWFSDHVCFTKAAGIEIGHLAPLPFTPEAVDVIVRNISTVRRYINKPLILENITYNVRYSNSEMTEPKFLSSILERTGCGLLLDVTNLYINSINLEYDWREFLDQLALERVVQLHFVGSRQGRNGLVDAHADPTGEDIWNVFREVAVKCDIKGAILERDDNFPEFSGLLEEVRTARTLVGGVRKTQFANVLS